jgi:uncharacterized RDD family membrane protein YckC
MKEAFMVRIGFLMRFLAALIDGIILGIVCGIIGMIIRMVTPVGYIQLLVITLVTGAISLAYFYLEVLKAQTPGKMALKLKITQQDGSPASNDQLMKRYLFKQVPNILGIVAGVVGFIGILHTLVSVVGGLAGLALLICACFMLRENKLAYYDEMLGTAVYGAGTMPAGFPVTAQTPPPPPAQ